MEAGPLSAPLPRFHALTDDYAVAMLVFDELKKSDPQLRLLAVALAAGLFVLLAGLWWIQVVSARAYQGHLEMQAYRTVRLPAVRGKILDRCGRVMAENRPRYSLDLYLDDLSGRFKKEYDRLRPVKVVTQPAPLWKLWHRTPSVVTQRVRLKPSQIEALTLQAHYDVVSAVAAQLGRELGQPVPLDAADFERSYEKRLAMPYPVLKNLNEVQIARFEENDSGELGADLEMQTFRTYPLGTTAGHLLGYLHFDDSSSEGEDSYFSYRLPDYHGIVGIEGGFDTLLRGRAGVESVLVNNLGYRQSENMLEAPEPGDNVVLTIDLDIQQAAEQSLKSHQGTNARAAVVVMDVRSGDVLALVSSPEINPDYLANDPKFLTDPKLHPEINRATWDDFAPGSVFKTVVALAALEDGLDPNVAIYNPENPEDPGHGHYVLGRRSIRDTAPPGDYNFRRAIERSCNTYFITVGLRAGVKDIIEMGERFHLGEHTGLPTRQDGKGSFPSVAEVEKQDWYDGRTANICIGQGEIAVTPMQVAVMISAIANGGKVLWPRLVERVEPQDPASGEAATNFPAGLVRDELNVHPRSLKILHDSMLGETEDEEGTGKAARVPGLRICGKTGTAQIKNEHGQETGWNYWFASFAPYESPRYAVIVMVQSDSRGSGGLVCAPIAHDIYAAILETEKTATPQLTAK
jgi:penicillin-binding protein 2